MMNDASRQEPLVKDRDATVPDDIVPPLVSPYRLARPRCRVDSTGSEREGKGAALLDDRLTRAAPDTSAQS